MGYKLAGFKHLGGVEIDKTMAAIYKRNHHPEHFYLEDIRDFNQRSDLPSELYQLDLLDGSPPCSSFSMSGNREKYWEKKKKFREGQSAQTLDDLFFHYIDTVEKLKPKVAIAENVKGLVIGNAKSYVRKIHKRFVDAGYNVQLFSLNAATMGVPQFRPRVFFIASRKDLGFKKLELKFNQRPILYREIEDDDNSNKLSLCQEKYFHQCKEGATLASVHSKGSMFGHRKMNRNKPVFTIAARGYLLHYKKPRILSDNELKLAATFPLDYDFTKTKVKYVVGMSVPPVMAANIAHEIYKQWLSKSI